MGVALNEVILEISSDASMFLGFNSLLYAEIDIQPRLKSLICLSLFQGFSY